MPCGSERGSVELETREARAMQDAMALSPLNTKRMESVLGGASVVLVAAMLLGPSMTYLVHLAAFLAACRLLVTSADWRLRTGAYFSSSRGIWIITGLFSLAFLFPFFTVDFANAADASELKWVLVWSALFVPCAAIYRSEGKGSLIRRCYLAALLIIFLSVVNGAVQFLLLVNPMRELLGEEVYDYGRRATGLLRNPIPFGHVMGAFFWVAGAGALVAWTGGRKRFVLTPVMVAVGAFAAVLMSETRGVWLAIAVVTVLSVPLLKGRARNIWLGCLGAACLAGLCLVAASSETQARLLSAFDKGETSNRLRLELWQANFEILKDYPFGIGYNTNDQLMGAAFDELGIKYRPWLGHSHNEFVEIAVGSGWLGLGLYLWLSAWILWIAIRAFRRVSLLESPWASFILLSSILVQLFVNVCAVTDQISTPGRFLLCIAWAFAVVVPVETSLRSEESGLRGRIAVGR